jgi:hypothetical protein
MSTLERQLKRHRIHRKIIETRDAFINNNFDKEEALEAAIDKRKCLFLMHMKIWQ